MWTHKWVSKREAQPNSTQGPGTCQKLIEFKYPDHAKDDSNITFVFDVFSYSFRSIAKNWQLGNKEGCFFLREHVEE